MIVVMPTELDEFGIAGFTADLDDCGCITLPGLEKTKATYQGFTGQLAKYQSQLMQVIIPHLRELTNEQIGKILAYRKMDRHRLRRVARIPRT